MECYIIPKILNFEEMVSLYIKILKKTITDTELELFKYNLEISCCVPNVYLFVFISILSAFAS